MLSGSHVKIQSLYLSGQACGWRTSSIIIKTFSLIVCINQSGVVSKLSLRNMTTADLELTDDLK